MTKSRFRVGALVLMALLLVTNLYRAATQSIVHDEALSWQLYLTGPASTIFNYFDANNHFLATSLFRISTTLFGDSELAMRLPTVLAGAWFFWTVLQLCGLIFGDGWLFLLGCATLTLNPLLLDFLVAARGYGLAMAGLFWALFQMLDWFSERLRGVSEDHLHKWLWKAALGCSIAVAANLTFFMPALILAVVFCVLLLRQRESGQAGSPRPQRPPKKGKRAKPEASLAPARSYASFTHFVVPVIVLAIVFLLAAPIDLARSEDLYTGTTTALRSLRSLVDVSFSYGGGAGALHGIEQIWTNVALIFLPAMTVAALTVAAMTGRVTRSLAGLATLFASLAVAGSALLLAAAHLVSGIPYPEDRTGIYFVPLASLAALGLARILTERSGLPHWIGVAAALVLWSFALEFAAQWNVKSFWVWRYDADTKRIFEALEAAPKPAEQIRLGASWQLEPALNYYRVVRKASWLMPIRRDGFDGARQFYVLSPQDQNAAALPRLQPIYQGPVSGSELAISQQNQ